MYKGISDVFNMFAYQAIKDDLRDLVIKTYLTKPIEVPSKPKKSAEKTKTFFALKFLSVSINSVGKVLACRPKGQGYKSQIRRIFFFLTERCGTTFTALMYIAHVDRGSQYCIK